MLFQVVVNFFFLSFNPQTTQRYLSPPWLGTTDLHLDTVEEKVANLFKSLVAHYFMYP